LLELAEHEDAYTGEGDQLDNPDSEENTHVDYHGNHDFDERAEGFSEAEHHHEADPEAEEGASHQPVEVEGPTDYVIEHIVEELVVGVWRVHQAEAQRMLVSVTFEFVEPDHDAHKNA